VKRILQAIDLDGGGFEPCILQTSSEMNLTFTKLVFSLLAILLKRVRQRRGQIVQSIAKVYPNAIMDYASQTFSLNDVFPDLLVQFQDI
jgi:hypothetical protein